MTAERHWSQAKESCIIGNMPGKLLNINPKSKQRTYIRFSFGHCYRTMLIRHNKEKKYDSLLIY